MGKSITRNGKEGLLYGGVLCELTCIFMTTMNISINMGWIIKGRSSYINKIMATSFCMCDVN